MPTARLIPENLLATPIADAVGFSVSASMSVDNLLQEELGTFWRTENNTPTRTHAYFFLGNSIPVAASALALMGHNLYRNAAEFRVILTDNQLTTEFDNVLPNGVAASTNMTGAVTDVNEAFGPLGDWMTPTTGTDWDVRFNFATPSATPQTGTKKQSFWAFVKASSTPASLAELPTVKAELYEAGVLVLDLGTKPIASTTGQWVFWSWDAAELATASGADVELKLTFAGLATGIGSATYVAGHLDSVLWYCETTSHTMTAVTNGDLGWQTFTDQVGDAINFWPVVDDPSKMLFVYFGSLLTFKRCYLWIRSDHAPTGIDATDEIPPTPPGYLQISVASLGQAYSTTIPRDLGGLVGVIDESPKQYTDGGASFGSRRRPRRFLPLPLSYLTPAEAHALFDRLPWRHGTLKPIAISVLQGDATEGKHTTLWATLRNPEVLMEAREGTDYNRALSLEFIEEL